MHRLAVLALLSLTSALAHPTSHTRPLPLVIWHGLGDRSDAEGLHSVGDLAAQVYPDTYVHYVTLDPDGDGDEDRKASFFGNVSAQLDTVCAGLRNDTKLLDTDGHRLRVDALGFSQGGQFLRGLVERCEGLSVRTLMTFGSQHNGISEFSKCGQWDFLCKGALGLVKGNAWSDWVQSNIVPAQYYRKTDEETGLGSEDYLLASHFLADVNNERELKNTKYAARVAALDKFVMYVFEDDTTVIPKESGWFAEVNATSGEVTPLPERRLYKEDWLGLRKLDEKDGLVLATHPGGHMQLKDKLLKEAFEKYFGPETGSSVLQSNFVESARQIVVDAWRWP